MASLYVYNGAYAQYNNSLSISTFIMYIQTQVSVCLQRSLGYFWYTVLNKGYFRTLCLSRVFCMCESSLILYTRIHQIFFYISNKWQRDPCNGHTEYKELSALYLNIYTDIYLMLIYYKMKRYLFFSFASPWVEYYLYLSYTGRLSVKSPSFRQTARYTPDSLLEK